MQRELKSGKSVDFTENLELAKSILSVAICGFAGWRFGNMLKYGYHSIYRSSVSQAMNNCQCAACYITNLSITHLQMLNIATILYLDYIALVSIIWNITLSSHDINKHTYVMHYTYNIFMDVQLM